MAPPMSVSRVAVPLAPADDQPGAQVWTGSLECMPSA